MYILLGLAFGIALAYFLILPSNLLNLTATAMTLGDLVRIIGGVCVVAFATWIGVVIREQIG